MTSRAAPSRECGQAMVEYALVSIPFFLLVLGLFDLGRGVLYYNMLANAAREGARAGIVVTSDRDPDTGYPEGDPSTWSPNQTAICTVARRAAPLPNPSSLSCTVPDRGAPPSVAPDGSVTPGAAVRVKLTYNFRLIVPLVERIFGGPLTLRASSTMNVEA